jgi:tripartite-type tricarboxylate transporter receptor subunit TctC
MQRIGYVAALFAAITIAAPVKAADVGDFYKGKTMKLIVGSAESSGVDILGRLAAKHLVKHIAGSPNIIVQNMAAPESIQAANHIFNVAEPDGLSIGAGSSGLFSRAISQPGIRFELDQFSWIGNLYNATVIFWMRTDFPCQTFEQLKTCPQPLKFGATAKGSTGYGLVPELLKDAMGLNMDIIYGYRNNDIELAVERGEIHASGGDLIGFLGGRGFQLMQEGKVKILVQVAGQKSPSLERYNTPWVMDVIPPARKDLFTMLNPILDLARPYFAPPKMPADRLAHLRDAFAKVSADPDFRDEVKKVASIEPALVRGEDMDRAIKAMLNQPPEVKNKIIGLLKGE